MRLQRLILAIRQARRARRDTANIDAYDYLLRGRDYLSRFTREANDRTREMFERALEIGR